MNTKRPIAVWFALAALVLIALIYALNALGSVLGLFQKVYTLKQALGGGLIGAAIGGLAVLAIVRSIRQTIAARSVVLFFWLVLFIYPISNGLAQAGLFPPSVPIANNELGGAAAAEGLRYLGLIGLILWLSFSKATKEYLSAYRHAGKSHVATEGSSERIPPTF